jgi:hypothetical protein
LKIPEDEEVIGFKVQLSNWVDCKISKIAFKTIKFLKNDQVMIHEQNSKWFKESWVWHKMNKTNKEDDNTAEHMAKIQEKDPEI